MSGKLNESGMLPSNIIEFSPDATLVINRKGKVIAWNRAMEDMTGVKANDMIGKGDHEYAIPFYGQRKPILVDMLELPFGETNNPDLENDMYLGITARDGKLEASTIKARLKGKDTVLWGTASKLFNARGKVIGSIECIRDITAQKRMEDELRVQEEKYRLMTTHIKDGIAIIDLGGRITFANPAALKMTGYSAREVIGRQFAEVTTNKDRDTVIEIFSRALAGRAAVSQLEIDILSKHGLCIPIELSAGYMRDKSGAVNGLIIAFRDVTERKKAEEELRASRDGLERRVEERTAELAYAHHTLHAIIDTIPAGVIVASSEMGCVSYANQSAVNIFSDAVNGMDLTSGQRPYMLMRLDRSPLKHEEMPLYRSMSFGEHVSDAEILVCHPGGREIAVLLSSAPIGDGKGHNVSAVAIALDITERKRIESALRESEQKFRVLAETMPSAIFIYQNRRFVYVNQATTKITGYSRDELLTMNFWEWVHPDHQKLVQEYSRARTHGLPAPARYEVKFVTRSGDEGWVEIMPGHVEYEGKPAIIVTAVDVTERKQSEEALKNAKEQAEIYIDLLGHDINNMNQVAIGYLELAQGSDNVSDAGKLMSRALEMLRSSSALIETVRKIQQAVGGSLKLEPVDLGDILFEAVSESQTVPGREIKIRYERVSGQRVLANRLLKDVFQNMIGNAIKHSEGRLNVSVEVVELMEHDRRLFRVNVEDDGPGISDDMKEKIFSRMNKGHTKASGSGLGLYLVKMLVRNFKGHVWVEDRVAGDYTKGSRFVVILPATERMRAEGNTQIS